MPNAKKRNFVTRQTSKKERARWGEGDLFYFDQESWDRIMELAQSSGELFTRKGDKRPREHVARMIASAKRNRLAKLDAYGKARRAAHHAKHAGKPGPRLADRILDAMRPGEWYGPRDIANVIGVEVRTVRSTLLLKMEPRGLVRRVDNEAWRGTVGQPEGVEPQFLWGLTDAGAAARAKKGRPPGGAKGPAS